MSSSPSIIPIRQLSNVWVPTPVAGCDINHEFEISNYSIEFITSGIEILPGEEIIITNLSSGYDETYNWTWVFSWANDAGPMSQTIESMHPGSFTYPDDALPGSYDIRVFFTSPIYDELVKENYITILDPDTYFETDFDAVIDDNKTGDLFGNSPLTINFTDISSGNPNQWDWDFGDTYATSTEQNPTYIFENFDTEPKQFTITLNSCKDADNCDVEIKENYITVYPAGASLDPIANFSYDQSSLFSPSEVSFINTSSGNIDSYEWYKNNYLMSTDEVLPTQTFTETTTVKLIVKDASGTIENQFSRQINVYTNPASGVFVDFIWGPVPLTVGDYVNLNENVTGFYYYYNVNWIFEEPGTGYTWTSFQMNPIELFSVQGIYKVTLEVYDINDNFIGVCQKNVEVGPPSVYEPLNNEVMPIGGSESSGHYGESVAINENYTVVGAPYFGNPDWKTGWVFIYEYDEMTKTWSLNQGGFHAEDSEEGDLFGCDVGISGDYMIIGASHHNYLEDPTGCAYVFKNIAGTWVQHQKLVPADATLNDYVGTSVAIDGNYLVIGAPAPLGIGKAYVYKLEGDTWIEKDKIFRSLGSYDDEFGYFVDISSDRIAVGNYNYGGGS